MIRQCELQICLLFAEFPPAVSLLLKQYRKFARGLLGFHDIVQTVSFGKDSEKTKLQEQIAITFDQLDNNPDREQAARAFMALNPSKKLLFTVYDTLKERFNSLVAEGDFDALRKRYHCEPKTMRDFLIAVSKNIRKAQKIKNRIICANLHLTPIIVAKYMGQAPRNSRFEDLVQEGNIGLIIAVDKFELARGTRFSTYASWWIRQAITRSNFERMVHVPSYLFETARKIAICNLDSETGNAVNITDLSKKLGESEKRISRALQYTTTEIVHLEERISENSTTTFAECLPDESLPSMETNIETTALSQQIDEALKILPKRERYILIQRFGFYGETPKTLEEIGEELGYTRERIRQLEASALKKLRHPVYGHVLFHRFDAIYGSESDT